MAASVGLNAYSLYARLYNPRQYGTPGDSQPSYNQLNNNGSGGNNSSNGSSKPDAYVSISSSAKFAYANIAEFPSETAPIKPAAAASLSSSGTATEEPHSNGAAGENSGTSTAAGGQASGSGAADTTASQDNTNTADATGNSLASNGGMTLKTSNAIYDGLSKSFSIPQGKVQSAYGAFSFGGTAFNTVDIFV